MENLVKKAKKGNEEAFSKLILAEKDSLYKIAISRMKTIEDAEDVIQETVIEAYVKMHTIRKNESFKSWIRTILLDMIKTFYERKAQKDIKIQTKLMENFEKDNVNNIIKTEQDMDFKMLLNKLEDEDRTIILLFYNDGYKVKEISKMLNMNVNTVKTKLSRARKKIEKMKQGGDKIGSTR